MTILVLFLPSSTLRAPTSVLLRPNNRIPGRWLKDDVLRLQRVNGRSLPARETKKMTLGLWHRFPLVVLFSVPECNLLASDLKLKGTNVTWLIAWIAVDLSPEATDAVRLEVLVVRRRRLILVPAVQHRDCELPFDLVGIQWVSEAVSCIQMVEHGAMASKNGLQVHKLEDHIIFDIAEHRDGPGWMGHPHLAGHMPCRQ